MVKTVSLIYVRQITATTESLLNIRVGLSRTIYNCVPVLAISWNLHTSTISTENLQCKENAYTGFDVRSRASKS